MHLTILQIIHTIILKEMGRKRWSSKFRKQYFGNNEAKDEKNCTQILHCTW